uniref:C3H1-type domain-containing protein n=1 Tax=Leersia perrieri TaxID=77586 RepID=A0A0D9WKM8_9ORYZ
MNQPPFTIKVRIFRSWYQHRIQQRSYIAAEDKKKPLDQFASDIFRDNSATGYLEVAEHGVIGESTETVDAISVHHQVKEAEHDVAGQSGQTMDAITVDDQVKEVEHDATVEGCETADGIAVDDQVKEAEHDVVGESGETVDAIAVDDQVKELEHDVTGEGGETADDIAVDDQVKEMQHDLIGQSGENADAIAVGNQGKEVRHADIREEEVEQCVVGVFHTTKDKDAMEEKVEQNVIGKEVIAMKTQDKAVEQCTNDELRTNKNEKAVNKHIRVEGQGAIDENVVELCIDDELRAAKDVVTFPDQGNMLEQTIGDEQGATKGKFAVQNNIEMVDHVSYEWGTTEDDLAINMLKAKPDVSSLPSENENHGVTEILELNRVGLPIREGARNCSYYMHNGTCSYGKKCHFNHPEQVIDAQFDPPTGWEDDALPSPPPSKIDDKSYFKRSFTHVASEKKSSTSEVLPPNILRMLLPPQKVAPGIEEKAIKVNKDTNWPVASDDCNGCRSTDSSGRDLCKQEYVNYPERPGRPECPFYTRFGDCKFASSCKYHHSKDKFPRRSSVGSDNSSRCRSADSSGGALCKREHVSYPERPGRPECPFYTRYGDCKFASACKYHHSKDRFPSTCHSNDLLQGELVEYPERPGEPECPFYMKNRFCQFGVECKFHHTKGSIPTRWSLTDVKKPLAPEEHHPTIEIKPQDHMCQQDQYPERPGQPDCRYYMQFGKCKYFSACIFHHPKDRLSNGWHPLENVLKQEEHKENTLYPERPGELECVYFMRHGSCKFQRNCKYHHPKDRLSKKLGKIMQLLRV